MWEMTNALGSWPSLDEVDDCHNFAFTWIQEHNTPEEKETHLDILGEISCILEV
jgi:hypothetical protein